LNYNFFVFRLFINFYSILISFTHIYKNNKSKSYTISMSLNITKIDSSKSATSTANKKESKNSLN